MKPVLWLPGNPPTPSQPPATCGPAHVEDGVRSNEMYEREIDLPPTPLEPAGEGGGGGRSDPWPELSCILTIQNIQKIKLYTQQKLYTHTKIRFKKDIFF